MKQNKMTTASICTIGDEILIGQVVDTNSSHISLALNSLGIKVTRMLSIGDDHDAIVQNLEDELRNNNIVIVTGGLGPTKDDITKKALAELSKATAYKTDAKQLEIVHRILSSRGPTYLTSTWPRHRFQTPARSFQTSSVQPLSWCSISLRNDSAIKPLYTLFQGCHSRQSEHLKKYLITSKKITLYQIFTTRL